MTDSSIPEAPAAGAPQSVPVADPAQAAKKREEAQQVLQELLRLMEIPGRVELKDQPDGGIGVALQLEGELPGLAAGKRSNVIDALQFLANKIVNKPNTEKRWISIGVGAFPEPRGPKPPRQPQAQGGQGGQGAAPGAPAPQQQQARAPQQPGQQQQPRPPKPPREPRPPQGQPGQAPAAAAPQAAAARPSAPATPQELSLEVAEDAALTQAVKELAEKSAKLGRFFAIAPMKAEDRARVAKAATGTPGMSLKLEGDGRARRIVFVPEKPVPMPKMSSFPADLDEDEEA